jgi:hypothetical protein
MFTFLGPASMARIERRVQVAEISTNNGSEGCISSEELCSDVLDEFRKYTGHVLALDSSDKLDYSRLRRMLRDLSIAEDLSTIPSFD